MDIRILDFIEGMYSRKLNDKEALVLNKMLENETLESFKRKYQFVLTKRIDYFTPAKMQQLIDEENEIQAWLVSAGLNSLDDLYEN